MLTEPDGIRLLVHEPEARSYETHKALPKSHKAARAFSAPVDCPGDHRSNHKDGDEVENGYAKFPCG